MMFRWLCLALAAVTLAFSVWVVLDLRQDLKQTARTLNENLPQILENTNRSTETLAVLAEDMRNLRDLAGATGRDRSLAVFADRLLDKIESSGGRIGLKKLLGSGLKDELSAEEWAVSARKEGLWLAFRAKSQTELLERLCANKYGSTWMIRLGNEDPQPLHDWLSKSLPETEKPVEEQTEPQ